MGVIDTIKGWLIEDDPQAKDESGYYGKDYQIEDDKDALVIIYHPTGFMDAEEISRNVKQGRAVIINMENVPAKDRQRIIDFLSGVVLARDGMIAKIYTNVYMCSPKNIGIIER